MHFRLPFGPSGSRPSASGRFRIDPGAPGVCERGLLRLPSDQMLDLQTLFTRVVSAYSCGRLDDVSDVLEPALRDRLAREVAERQRMGHRLSSRLIEFISAEILAGDDHLLGGWVDVRVVSRMVVALNGADGELLAGDPDHARILSEVWSLQRSTKPAERRWLVAAMVEDE